MKLGKTKIHNQSHNNQTNCNFYGNHFVSVVFKNYNILSLFIIPRDKRKAVCTIILSRCSFAFVPK